MLRERRDARRLTSCELVVPGTKSGLRNLTIVSQLGLKIALSLLS